MVQSSLGKGGGNGVAAPRAAMAFPLPTVRTTLLPHAAAVEVTAEQCTAEELALPLDQLDSVRRRLLIAVHAFGAYAVAKVAAFAELPASQVRVLLESEEVQAVLRSGQVPCWSPAELVSRLCVEAERAPKPQDRLAALRMLMEYRSMAAPEGGSRSFKRVAAKFTLPHGGSVLPGGASSPVGG